jgi:predicted XRE-type DNA-binding protein
MSGGWKSGAAHNSLTNHSSVLLMLYLVCGSSAQARGAQFGAALQAYRGGAMKQSCVRITQGGGNVFLDLGFPPHEAAVIRLRCELSEALRKWMTREGLTQAQVAKRLGVVQSRISEIACNKVDKLSLDYLVGPCAKAGLTVAFKLAA